MQVPASSSGTVNPPHEITYATLHSSSSARTSSLATATFVATDRFNGSSNVRLPQACGVIYTLTTSAEHFREATKNGKIPKNVHRKNEKVGEGGKSRR